jgi:succinate dehydrogenase/fumarate reductase flavoprotein subunit
MKDTQDMKAPETETATSRRDFLRGAALVGAGVVGASLAGCSPSGDGSTGTGSSDTPAADGAPSGGQSAAAGSGTAQSDGVLTWLSEEPSISDADVESEVSADVVIVGCGVAGTVAARAAAEEGASVVVFDKASGPQCRSGDYAVLDGKINERWGRVDAFDHDEIADHEMDEQCYYPKRAIYKKWADNCGEVFDWFIAAYPELYICPDSFTDIPDESAEAFLYPSFYPLPEKYNWKTERYPTYPTTVTFGPSQAPVVNANWAKAEAAGAMPYWGHFAEKLIVEGGKVVGVYARNAESGKYVKATAAKGLIMAAGEYSSNPDILNYYAPEVKLNGVPAMWMNMDVEGNPTNTGDGLKMGVWAGAAIQQHHAPMIHYMGITGVGTSPYLRLNLLGQRFMNEDVPGQQDQNQFESQPSKKIYTFFDSAWPEQLQYFQPQHGSANYVVDALPKNLNIMSTHGLVTADAVESAIAAAAEGGEAGGMGGSAPLKADSIEALLEQISDIDKAAAKASIERYNQLAKSGKDDDFGKPASRMFALENPPYYAAESGMSAMLVCCGGLVSDEDCHVYGDDGKIIPGFYAAGNVQGSRYAVAYPIALRGVSHSLSMYYGYVAGKNAVAGV